MTITGPSQAKVGDVITITCVAENSNPPSDVNLVINGQTPPGATSRTQKVPNGGWNTITNLTRYEVRPIDADLMVNCYALNQALGSTKIDTEVISVLRECRWGSLVIVRVLDVYFSVFFFPLLVIV